MIQCQPLLQREGVRFQDNRRCNEMINGSNIMKKIISTAGIFIFAAIFSSSAFAANMNRDMNASRQMGNQTNLQGGGQMNMGHGTVVHE